MKWSVSCVSDTLGVIILFSASLFALVLASSLVPSNAETAAQNCSGCVNNTKTQILTIFNFQTKDNPFLAGNAAFLIQPNPYAHTTNSTDYLDLTTWFNFVVTDNGKFDSDPMPGVIELIGVNNGTYSVWQIKGSPGFGAAPHPVSSGDIFGTTGFSYVTQTFVNFTSSSTVQTIAPPVITDTVFNSLKANGAKVNGVSLVSSLDLPSSTVANKAVKLSTTPPPRIAFTTNAAPNTAPGTLFSTFSIPTYSAPKGTGISESAVFIPPVFTAPVSGGGMFLMSPLIDEINPGLNLVLRFEKVEQGSHGALVNAIELPMNTYGTDVGISVRVDTANPSGVPIPSGSVALFLNFTSTGDVDFGASSAYSSKPVIHFNAEKSGTTCPDGVVLYLLQSGHWHEVTPAPTRTPSGDTTHTCAYSSEVDHFSSYMVGTGSTGHDHGGDHGTGHQEHAGHDTSHTGHSHAGHAHGADHGEHSAYHIITQSLNIFEIEYNLAEATARIVVGTTGRVSDLQVLIYSSEGGVRTAHYAAKQQFIEQTLQNSMKKYVFEVPLHPQETFFRVAVNDRNYNLNQSVTIKGMLGKIIPWFANLHEKHDGTHDDHSAHTSHILNTGFEIKFDGSIKNLTYNGMQFPVKYEMAGSIVGLHVDEESKSVTFMLDYVSGGMLTIQVPRSLVDALDNNFVVFATASPTTEIKYTVIGSTAEHHTLRMHIPAGAAELTIMGSRVVPEFGPLAIIMLVSGFAGAMMIVRNKMASCRFEASANQTISKAQR